MKKTFAFLVFLLSINISFSQNLKTVNVPLGARVKSTEIIDGVSTHNYSDKSSIPINGIPYLKEEFQSGIIELADGKKSDEVLLRYNISKDIFEILRNNDTLTLNRPFAVKYVYLDDKVYIFNPRFLKNSERRQNGYFELRISGDFSLYIKRWKNLSYDSFAANYKGGGGTKEYYYIDKKNFVGKIADGDPFIISSPRSLLSKLDKHQSEVKSFIKKNKIKLKKESDLVRVVEYYNSL